jgi:glycosyltransferase involved in cell wall biosynthesis
MHPKITVFIPNYNGGEFLRESVESILHQTRPADQLIVLDDGSTDGSVKSIGDLERSGKVIIVRHAENRGKAAVLNEAFLENDADFYLIQDADDVAYPERIERQISFLDENRELVCSSGLVEYLGENDAYMGKGRLDLLDRPRLDDYLSGDEPFGLFCPCVILRAEIVRDPDLQFRGRFWPADDIDLWNRIAEAGHLVLAQPEVLVKYRIHGESAVTSSFMRTRMQFEWVRECLRARRRGVGEPDRDEFLKRWNSVSVLGRINRARKIYAKALYRGAGFARARGDLVGGILRLGLGGFLQPSYVMNRLKHQIFGLK